MENSTPYNLLSSSEETFIQYINCDNKNDLVNKVVSVNFNGDKIRVVDPSILQQKVIYKTYKSKAILGIIKIKTFDYVMFVTANEKIGKIKDEAIYKITDIGFCRVFNNFIQSDNDPEINDIKEGLIKLFKLGFYYSFGVDLTNSQQNQSKIIYNIKKNGTPEKNLFEIPHTLLNLEQKLQKIYITTYKKYFFNYDLYSRFIDNETNKPIENIFIIPVICGYINMFNFTVDNYTKNMQFILISRRSKNYCGTRYNTRGINDEGNVANFCESEQIIILDNNLLCAFSQLRGSVPIFFEQVGLKATTDITRDKNLTIQAFNKHLEEMNEDYPLIYFINLLNQKKTVESPIIAEFEKQIKIKKDNNKLRYIFFDMQNECQNGNYSRIDNLMQDIKPVIDLFSFFVQNLNTNEILNAQKGTTRTNCLDCLDRTNVIQTRISWLILEKIFRFLKIKSIDYFFNPQESFFSVNTNNPFKEKIKEIWGENGDQISIQYAGTASTITTVTKTGGYNLKGLIQHGIATFSRFYQGSFEDDFKQKCIDILLQRNSELNINPAVKNELLSRKDGFTKYNDYHIFIGNYNISGKDIENSIDVVTWLTSYKENNFFNEDKNNKVIREIIPDFFIIGFEEIVDLKAKNILINSNADKKNKLKEILVKAIALIFQEDEDNRYQIIKELDLVGLYLIVFTKSSIIKYISNFDYQIIRNGLMGAGNKGSLLLRFNIKDSSIAIACNHLSFGQEKSDDRKEEISAVLESTFKKYPGIKFKNYNHFFFFGDLNIRVNLEKTSSLIENLIKTDSTNLDKDFSELMAFDQFQDYKRICNLLSEMDEAPIKFSPTYKYIIGSYEYDIEKRVPSWCDRIFFKKFSNVECLAYNKCLLTISDHQPIYALFKIKVEQINSEKKKEIMENIIKEKQEQKMKKDNNANDNNGNNINNFSRDIENDIVDNFF